MTDPIVDVQVPTRAGAATDAVRDYHQPPGWGRRARVRDLRPVTAPRSWGRRIPHPPVDGAADGGPRLRHDETGRAVWAVWWLDHRGTADQAKWTQAPCGDHMTCPGYAGSDCRLERGHAGAHATLDPAGAVLEIWHHVRAVLDATHAAVLATGEVYR